MGEHVLLLERSGIDYENAYERFDGNTALYERMARRYADDTHFEELARTLAEGDADAAFGAAHSLKGVAGNLSFVALYKAASSVCDALHENDLQTARSLLPTVRSAHIAVTKALAQEGPLGKRG